MLKDNQEGKLVTTEHLFNKEFLKATWFPVEMYKRHRSSVSEQKTHLDYQFWLHNDNLLCPQLRCDFE